jgi:hypothetical protein
VQQLADAGIDNAVEDEISTTGTGQESEVVIFRSWLETAATVIPNSVATSPTGCSPSVSSR